MKCFMDLVKRTADILMGGVYMMGKFIIEKTIKALTRIDTSMVGPTRPIPPPPPEISDDTRS